MKRANNRQAIDTVIFDIGRVLVDFQPDLPLERISELVGYRTSTYFYKAFRQHFGKSPRDWQKGKS